ncbi:MAG: hypothetical protein Q9205_001911 [Flavoplaca limonia]
MHVLRSWRGEATEPHYQRQADFQASDTILTMPWQRVEEIAEYRLNTKKLDAWLKKKWGDHDYQIKVRLLPQRAYARSAHD